MQNSKCVIVLGFSVTALGTLRCIRSLKREGCEIILAGEPGHLTIALSSTIPDKKIIFQNGLIRGLLELGRERADKPALLITQDKDAVDISNAREQLEPYFRFLFPSKELLDILMEKSKFTHFAHEKNLSIPATYFINQESDLLKFTNPADYPLIVKPYLLHATKVFHPDDMKRLTEKLKPVNYTSLIVQDYIEGDDDNIVFCFLLFNSEGRPVHRMIARKLRQWPVSYGTTSLAETESAENLLPDLEQFIHSIEMYGYCSIEFKYDKSRNRYFIMEPTIGRFNQQIVLTKKAGVNFPLAMVRLLYGEPVDLRPQRNGVRWIYESNDFFSYLKSGSKYGYLRNFFRPHISVLFSGTDPIPFFAEWYKIIVHKINKRGNKSCLISS